VALAVADRLDSLVGLFAVGMQPTGTRDPYGLRRTAIGLVQILASRSGGFDLRTGLGLAAERYAAGGQEPSRGSIQACLEFIIGRQEGLLLAEGWPHDVVQAILGAQGHDPSGAAKGVAALGGWVVRSEWPRLLQAYARCARITRGVGALPDFNPEQDEEPASHALYAALLAAEDTAPEPGSVDGFVGAFRPMIDPIDRFFEEVLVMADEQTVRENRLALLRRIVGLADKVADLSRLEGF
jgi:glycyl-tRNA synthetase